MPQQEQAHREKPLTVGDMGRGGGEHEVLLRRRTIWSHQLSEHVGERVRVAGWLHHQRQLSGRTFVVLRDGVGTIQIVVESSQLIDELAGLLPETVVAVEGLVIESPQAPGGVELHEPALEVISRPVEMPPIELKRKVLKEQLPTILDHAPVAHRHPRQQAIFRLQAATRATARRSQPMASRRFRLRSWLAVQPRLEQPFSRSATSAKRPISRRARSFTSR